MAEMVASTPSLLELMMGGGRTPLPQSFVDGIEMAQVLASRLKRDAAPIRNGFIATPGPGYEELPTLAQILRSGRGSDVRLKLELSLLWAAVAKPYTVVDPARVWATLLGLGVEDSALRQIRSAVGWLESKGFLLVNREAGRQSEMLLQNEVVGGEYVTPSGRLAARSKADYYIKLPTEFWTEGWIQVWSGRAIAALLILMYMDASSGRHDRKDLFSISLDGTHAAGGRGVWLGIDFANDRTKTSEDTRYRGYEELRKHGLITSYPVRFTSRVDRQKRSRHLHVLQLERLNAQPSVVESESSAVDTQRRLAESNAMMLEAMGIVIEEPEK
jgi:hypothetical protein